MKNIMTRILGLFGWLFAKLKVPALAAAATAAMASVTSLLPTSALATVFGPALGPIGTVLGGLWKSLLTLVRWVWEAIQVVATRPVVLILLVLVLAYGFRLGIRVDRYLVTRAETETQTLKDQIEAAHETDKARADAAIAARDAAKRDVLPLFGPPVQPPPQSVVVSTPPPQTDEKIVVSAGAKKPEAVQSPPRAHSSLGNRSNRSDQPRRVRERGKDKDSARAVDDGVYRF